MKALRQISCEINRIKMEIQYNSNKRYALAAFILWVVSSYLCHLCSKYSLDFGGKNINVSRHWTLSIYLTVIQLCTVIMLIKFGQQNKEPSGTTDSETNPDLGVIYKEAMVIVILSHVSASYVTNISLELLYADSTFALKLIEPFMAALISRFIDGRLLTTHIIVSLPIIVLGAMGYAGNPFFSHDAGAGSLLAILSTVFLCTRNLAIKGLLKENHCVTLRPLPFQITFVSLCFGAVGFLWVLSFKDWIIPFVLGVLSSLFHLLNSYISAGVLLHYISVLSHAVASILKRIVVVFLLSVSRSRKLTFHAICSLVMCMAGLFVYIRGQRTDPHEKEGFKSHISLQEQCTRLKFLLFLGIMLGLLFYTIPPQISPRDLQNLDKIGIGAVVRFAIKFFNESSPVS